MPSRFSLLHGSPSRFFPNLLCTGGLALLILLVNGCSVTKYLPEGEYLYDGSSVTVLNQDSTENTVLAPAVTAVLDQNTNSKIPLIGYRAIWRWYRFEEKLAENPEKFADKEHWGEEPIFYDENVVERVNKLIENRASNEGFFNNESDWVLDTNQDARTIAADFTLHVGDPYEIDSVRYFITDESVEKIIDSLRPSTVLEKGKRYRLDAVKGERSRWENALRNEGYFYARGDDFVFLADTVSGPTEVDMLAKLKDDVPRNHLQPQRIVGINVYTNTPGKDSLLNYTAADSFRVGGLNVICKDCPLRPKIVDEAFLMGEGDLYSPEKHRKTLRRLASYNTFRYIATEYNQVPGTDSLLVLNAFMEPRLKRRFEGELGLSYNSADYFGPNVRLAYINRNLFRGAELLRLEGDFTLAQFLGNEGETRVPTSIILGLTARLEIPRLLIPNRDKFIPSIITSGTVFEIGGKVESIEMNLAQFADDISANRLTDLANIIEEDQAATERLSLAQFRIQFGYNWRRRVTKNHSFNPISIRLQNPVVSTDEVLDLARVSNLAPEVEGSGGNGRFDRMLVYSPNYTFNYDGRLKSNGTHRLAYTQFVSLNANYVTPVGSNADNRESEVSTYPLLDGDVRYYLTLNSTSQIVTRLRGGIAFPLFSDRAIVPYFDLFSTGGPNSLRGFAPRQVGPGATVPEENNLLSFGGFGNLVVETNVEYRHRINALLELAAFIDAGNVWTYKSELAPLETDFRTSAFSGQLAANVGIGFRFDLQFLIFRIDLAQPIQTPYGEEQLSAIRFPNQIARSEPNDGLRLVVAFGYPF